MRRYRESAAGPEPEGKMRVGFHIELDRYALDGGSLRYDDEIRRAVTTFETELRAFVSKELRDEKTDARLTVDANAQRRNVDYFMANVKGAIRIPAGTKPRNCTGPKCGQLIYDVPKMPKKKKTKWLGVDAVETTTGTTPVSIAKYKDNPIGIPPTDTEDGAGINHFADCPDAPQFRRR